MKTVDVVTLEEMLQREQENKIDPRDFYSWGETDEIGYQVAQGKRDARIGLLKELIQLSE